MQFTKQVDIVHECFLHIEFLVALIHLTSKNFSTDTLHFFCPYFLSYTFLSFRLRDLNGYNKIWKLINSTLNATDYEVKWSDTFTGDQEARFSWVAANMLEEQNSKVRINVNNMTF